MNVGIIISISEYFKDLSPLPSCKKDYEVIEKVLHLSKKYDKIFFENGKTDAVLAKQRLIDFIDGLKTEEIDEVFFYYSGHGGFDGNEFYYLFANYEKNKKKQTSLENTELDNLLKRLDPKITVKVVDACQSGISYVKDNSNLEIYLKGTQAEFKKCYFYFSSHTNQSSYQDTNLSFFTKSFVEAISNYPQQTIRYKDIIDYISDTFNNPGQKPYFVVQADFTETFASYSSTAKNELNDLINTLTIKDVDSTTIEQRNMSIVELVKSEAAKYCSEKEALEVLDEIQRQIENLKLSEEMSELYSIDFLSSTSYDSIPKGVQIGKWFDQNSHSYFAKPTVVQRKIEKNIFSTAAYELMAFKHLYPDRVEYESVVEGVESTMEMPYSYLKVELIKKYPNLNDYSLIFIPFLSKTDVIVFSLQIIYKDKGWTERSISKYDDFKSTVLKLKDKEGLIKYFNNSFEEFISKINESINNNYKLLESSE